MLSPGESFEEPADYITIHGTLEFKHGETSKDLTVEINPNFKGGKTSERISQAALTRTDGWKSGIDTGGRTDRRTEDVGSPGQTCRG